MSDSIYVLYTYEIYGNKKLLCYTISKEKAEEFCDSWNSEHSRSLQVFYEEVSSI